MKWDQMYMTQLLFFFRNTDTQETHKLIFFNVLLLTLLKCFLPEETEYEYSGSDEEDENRGDDRESR